MGRTEQRSDGRREQERRQERDRDQERFERRRQASDVVTLGLLAAPGLPFELAEELARDLPKALRRRFPNVEWRVEVREEPAAVASSADVDLIQIARERMIEAQWSLAVCLTDFPVHIGTRPTTAYASATHGVGLVSVPALGAVNLDRRVHDAVLRVIEGLLGEHIPPADQDRDRRRDARMRQRLEELASPVGHKQVEADRGAIRFVTAVARGNVRLLIGMVRANRPWRLVTGLSRAVVGALSLAVFGIASPGVWFIADGMPWWHCAAIGVASVIATMLSLVAAHRLWERPGEPRAEARERAVLFNLATVITVAIGVGTLYLALFAINFVSAVALIRESVLAEQLKHPAGLSTYVTFTWLVTSLSTIGGALGAALENDRSVRLAAYGRRRDALADGEHRAA
jgi:uncharacterized membrane protein